MKLSKKGAASLSVFSNLFLTLLKLVVGIISGSMAILAEGAHSGFDLLASLIAYFSVRMSDRPPDQEHPYGHTKIENISGVLEASLIFLIAIWIIYEAVQKILRGAELSYLPLGIAIMVISLVANIIISRILYRVARKTSSIALEADAAHLYSDVLTSAGVILTLAVIWGAQRFFQLKLFLLDPIFSVVIAFWILGIAYRLTRKSYPALLDGRAQPETEEEVRAMIQRFCQDRCQFHKLRTRQSGPKIYIDFHLQFLPETHIEEAHQMSHELKKKIEEALIGSEVIIHLEPFENEGG